jgi:hypothetical protein
VNPGTREDTNNQRGQRVQGAQLCTQKSNPARALGLFAKSRVWGSRDKFNPGHGTHFALVRSTMPKAGKPHSGRWVAYYRVSTDRQATAALGSTRSVSSLAIISTERGAPWSVEGVSNIIKRSKEGHRMTGTRRDATTSPRLPFRGLLGPPEGAEAHTLAIGPLAARQKGTLHPLLSANCDVACTAYCRLL